MGVWVGGTAIAGVLGVEAFVGVHLLLEKSQKTLGSSQPDEEGLISRKIIFACRHLSSKAEDVIGSELGPSFL